MSHSIRMALHGFRRARKEKRIQKTVIDVHERTRIFEDLDRFAKEADFIMAMFGDGQESKPTDFETLTFIDDLALDLEGRMAPLRYKAVVWMKGYDGRVDVYDRTPRGQTANAYSAAKDWISDIQSKFSRIHEAWEIEAGRRGITLRWQTGPRSDARGPTLIERSVNMHTYQEINEEATIWADRLCEAQEMLDYFDTMCSAYKVHSRAIVDKLEFMKALWMMNFTAPDNDVLYWAAYLFQTDLIARKVDIQIVDDVYYTILKGELLPENIPDEYFDEARRKLGRDAE